MSTETEYPTPYQVWLDQCLRVGEAESVSYLEFLERRTKLPRFIRNGSFNAEPLTDTEIEQLMHQEPVNNISQLPAEEQTTIEEEEVA
jgi:hypothetical protein